MFAISGIQKFAKGNKLRSSSIACSEIALVGVVSRIFSNSSVNFGSTPAQEPEAVLPHVHSMPLFRNSQPSATCIDDLEIKRCSPQFHDPTTFKSQTRNDLQTLAERYKLPWFQDLQDLRWKRPQARGIHQYRPHSVVPQPSNGRRKFMIDTLALVRKLEAQGLSPQQAEGITDLISEIMNDSMEEVSAGFVSKQDMQLTEMMAETTLTKFKNDIKSSQEQNYDTLRRETERLRTEVEKVRSELRYELDKVTAAQRLDMNLEKGRMREELQKQSQETGNLNNRLDKEINGLKAEMEAAKFDVIKYCVGTLVSVSAVGLGILRILM